MPTLSPAGRSWPFRLLGLLCFLVWQSQIHAQWRTQELELKPGWNAVFLEVDPEPSDCARALAGVPVESVWLFRGRGGAPQFVSDPRHLTPASPDWLVYLPSSAPDGIGVASTLFSLPGGRPYLIKLGGSRSVTWRVAGQPRVRPQRWIGQAFNFVGFHLDPATRVSVQDFFLPSAALRGQAAYELVPTGEWRLISNRTDTALTPGKAYWVYAATPTEYSGPLAIAPDQPGVIAFGPLGRSAHLRVANLGNQPRELTLRLQPSEVPPAGDFPGSAGPLVLGVRTNGASGFIPWTAPLAVPLGPGQVNELRFELRRHEMAPYAARPAAVPPRYQGLLEVSDGAGMRVILPLSAEPPAPPAHAVSLARQRRPADGGEPPLSFRAGLWAGFVAVDRVSDPRHLTDAHLPRPAGSEFQFRVLLHVDAAGVIHLLREAFILFKPGVPASPTNERTVPGEYVIATDDSLLDVRDATGQPLYIGSTLRDGVRVGRRLSSANFSFPAPLPLEGLFGVPGEEVSGEFTLAFNDPLHPFRHLYHPDHDNRDREFQPYTASNEELWDLTRRFAFRFTTEDPDPNVPPQAGFGSEILAGDYEESVQGLHKETIHLAGTFRIQRVLHVNRLNDGR
ncbi:MAG: hypothetical protein HS113_27115 [Verrucomicrobiales bacterium]|nr:hypothetical protein [Verrucomicrobiales bacterium]